MTLEEMNRLFNGDPDNDEDDGPYDGEYLEFSRIQAPLHPRPDVCAFLMLHALVPGTRDMVSAAEHDEIWLDVDCEALASVVTEGQIVDLIRCGVRYDDDTESLAMFA